MNSPHTSTMNTNTFRPVLVPSVTSNVQRTPSANYDYPLKIVVNSKYIGAIIGFSGCSIREISKLSKAKCMVDVHNSTFDENGNLEKIIWISGTLEGCSNACLRIMQVIQGELEKENATVSNFELKIRVPNQLVGRLIGKGGASVKRIMEETSASISISDSRSSPEVYPMYQDYSAFERAITIRANSLDAVSNCERKISQKLKNYYDSDLNLGLAVPPNTQNFGGLVNIPPFMINSPHTRDGLINGFNFAAGRNTGISNTPGSVYYPPANMPLNNFVPNLNVALPHNSIQLKSHIFVPNNIVGALIGAKGFHIRNMMFLTGATIYIENMGLDSIKKSKGADVAMASSDAANPSNNAKNKTGNSVNIVEEEPTVIVDTETIEVNGNANTEEKLSKGMSEKLSIKEEVECTTGTEKETDNFQKKSFANKSLSSIASMNPGERCVTITGLDFQVYKAEFWVFQRIAESAHQFFDELVLTTETFVPSKVIGRIIGKSGQNVRELQRITQATVKVLEDLNNQNDLNSETLVRVTGNYFSLQAVQCRFGMLIADSEQRELNENKRSKSIKGSNTANSATATSLESAETATNTTTTDAVVQKENANSSIETLTLVNEEEGLDSQKTAHVPEVEEKRVGSMV